MMIAFGSCEDDEGGANPIEEPFHITLGLPAAQTYMSEIVSLGKLSVMITEHAHENSLNLICIDEFGNVKWSKVFSCSTEDGLGLWSAGKLSDQTFLVFGTLGSGDPYVAEIDAAGTVRNASKISGSNPVGLLNFDVTPTGDKLWCGYYYEWL